MHTISTTSQVIKFVARNVSASYDVVITDEQSKEVTSKTISSIEVGNYQQMDLSFTCSEAKYYTIEMYTSGDLQYRGKMFCTNQTELPKYTITKDQYKEETSSDNEYIIYE